MAKNKAYLETDRYLSMYFTTDSEMITVSDAENYAVEAQSGGEKLLAIRAYPYSTVLFGSVSLASELVSALHEGGCKVDSLLGSDNVVKAVADIFNS